jgi:outer membrane protein insertion porin family
LTKRLLAVGLLLVMVVSAMAQEASLIKEIIVRGNNKITVEAILGLMRTQVGQPYVQENLDRDRRSIEDLGNFSSVNIRAIPVDNGQYSITVDVVEYSEVKEIRIVGNSVVPTEKLLEIVNEQLKPGQLFNFRVLDPISRRIEKYYTDRGYFARVIDFGPLGISPGTINLVIAETRVGTIAVQGNTTTKDWVFKRLIRTRTGDAFNGDRWGRDVRRIIGTGWFEPGSFRVIEDPDREIGAIDLTLELKEARTGTFNAGLQVDPQNSLAGVVRLSQQNVGGTGQTVSLDYLQTTQGGGASVGVDYVNPFFDTRSTALSVGIYSRVLYRFNNFFNQNAPTANNNIFERRTGGTVGLARPISETETFGTSFRFENSRTFNQATINQDGFIQQDGEVAGLSFAYTADRRDLITDPSRGSFLRVETEPGNARITRVSGAIADESLLGSHNFVKAAIEYRGYFSDQPPRGRNEPDAPRRVLAVRARYGVISGTIPFFEQYFAGGANTLRGYDEDRFWGRNQLITSVEYRYPLQRSFNVVTFVDYGGAWGGYGAINNFEQSRTLRLNLGYGVGISFRTPLGPIRVDFGFNPQGQSRTHFLIGSSF